MGVQIFNVGCQTDVSSERLCARSIRRVHLVFAAGAHVWKSCTGKALFHIRCSPSSLMKHFWRPFKFSVSCTRIFYKSHFFYRRRTLKSWLFVLLYVYQTVLYSVGGRVGFFQGDIRLLPDDMKALKPTVFPVVPRLLNRVYDKVWNYTHSHCWGHCLIHMACCHFLLMGLYAFS